MSQDFPLLPPERWAIIRPIWLRALARVEAKKAAELEAGRTDRLRESDEGQPSGNTPDRWPSPTEGDDQLPAAERE